MMNGVSRNHTPRVKDLASVIADRVQHNLSADGRVLWLVYGHRSRLVARRPDGPIRLNVIRILRTLLSQRCSLPLEMMRA